MIHLQESRIHKVFVIGLFLKGLNSILEIIIGVLILFTGSVTAFLSFFINQELVEDPSDFFANQIRHFIPYFLTHTGLFASFYLLFHGVVKIFLVISLLKDKLWAYPATIAVLFLFIAYQLIRLAYSFSVFLVILTLFDILLVILTWHEYRIVRSAVLIHNH